jgi:hypothetical protein
MILILISCNQSQPKADLSDTSSVDTTLMLVDTTITLVDTNQWNVDTSTHAGIPEMKPTKTRAQTIDEIADTRYPNSLRLQMGNDRRPLTQAEIEEDEFYEEYKRLRDQKRKAKARERALKEVNKKY